MNYLERIAHRAMGQAAPKATAQPRARTTPDGPDSVALPPDDLAARGDIAAPVRLPAERPPASELVSSKAAQPAPERVMAPDVRPGARERNPPPDSTRLADGPHEQVGGEERVVHVVHGVVQETVREAAAASRPDADRAVVPSAERARAQGPQPAERSAEAPPEPAAAATPVQSLDDLLRQVPGQVVAQPVAAPAPRARPSVTIRRLVVEVTRPTPPAPPVPRRPRRRGARLDTKAGSSSRLPFGLGQS
ncbi:MAG: hypothetical protein GY937_25505 [bacterium]|nr:hypothetical protein [bacterium]